jgi:SulP family sulfate permease
MPKHMMRWIGRVLPIARWLADYHQDDARADVVAGITVSVMLIPQGMAYAVIAGLPPIYGLYAALVPPLIYPLVSSSRHLSWGPTALDMLILAAGIGALAEVGTDRYVTLAILLTAMVGLMQIAMGAAQLGFVANLLSRPVIAGVTTAAALIIGFSQLGNFLGIDLARSQYVHYLAWEAIQRVGESNVPSIAIGAASIAVLVGLPRWKPRWPEALIVVVIATTATWAFGWTDAGVEVVASVPDGLPGWEVPDLQGGDVTSLLPTALTLALVQFMNVVSLGRVFAARHNYAIDANRELVGMGASNLVGSFFQAIPTSGSFSRSAVNDQAGARTPLSNIVAAGIVALTLLFLTPLFYYLPMPALAAIITVSGFGLIDVDELKALFEAKERDGVIALVTAMCILFVGIQEGILLGIAASVLAVLYRISRPNVAELGHVPGTRLFRDLERFEQAVRVDDVLVLRADAAFSFANAEYIKDFILESGKERRDIEAVVIDGTSINDLDTTAIEALRSVIETLEEQGIALHFTGLIGPVREVMVRSGLLDKLGSDHFHMDPHDAIVHVLRVWDLDDDGDRIRQYFEKTEAATEQSTPAAS